MTELAKDEAELLDAMVDAIWDHLMPEARWTCKPYVERDLRAAIRGAGWVVVPRKLTLPMMAAGGPVVRAACGLDNKNATMDDVWETLIAAAPEVKP